MAQKTPTGMPGAAFPEVRSNGLSFLWDLRPGITERFGEDIFDRLEKEGGVQIVWPNRNNPDVDPLKKFTWTLTKKVSCLTSPCSTTQS